MTITDGEGFSFCRFCHAFCGIRVTVEGGRPTRVVGDVENPLYRGYSCIKGRALPEQHAHPDRLLQSRKRMPDGSFVPIPAAEAMDEIAARLTDIVREHGPRSVALYSGTYSFHYAAGAEVARGFMNALGSKMQFNSGSIDQPGKGVAKALHGMWNAGPQPFDEADTWMIVGANPTVSMWGGPAFDPARHLREAKARGMKLIVIDPRRTETAAMADLFLQPRPGEDPTVLAGILRVILTEGLHDAGFVADEVEGFDALRRTVERFTPDHVERRARVPAADLVAAARMFASGRSGSVVAGTGPNMAAHGTLTEYLIACIQTVCGRWLRAGERVPNPFVMMPTRRARAQADQRRGVSYGQQLRVRGLGNNPGGLPTAALADEILLEGEGQVRALFSLGGNPVAAWPDQNKTVRAMEALELLVTLDPKMSATAKMADYVIAPRLSLESDAITLPNEQFWGFAAATAGFPVPYGMYARALVDPPAGSDVIEEWAFFYGLAQRMGLEIDCAGARLDMATHPTTEDIHRLMTRTGRIPLDEVMRHSHGHVFEDPSVVVGAKEEGWPHRLDVGNASMMAELGAIRDEPEHDHEGLRPDERFAFRLVSRRLRDVYNSSGRDIPHLVRTWTYNPAFMHPDDIAAHGLVRGDVVEIDSGHATILGVVEPAPELAHRVISMAHAWGDPGEDEAAVHRIGSNTGRLVDNERDYDPISGIPVMSAIPVNIRRVALSQPVS